MVQFLSEKFYLNGITSNEMGVCLITFDNDVIKDFGNIYSQSMSSEGNVNNNPFYSEDIPEVDDITLNIVNIDSEGNAKSWKSSDFKRVTNWLVSDTFIPFISYDDIELVYYVKCTNINKKLTNDKKGYLECTFKIYGDCAYNKFSDTFSTNTVSPTVIYNTSNVNEVCKPIIKITNKGNGNTINRININGNVFEIKGLVVNESVTIDNRMCTVFNDNKENRLGYCNRNWLGLNPGENSISISGNCEVELSADFKVRL